MLRLWEGLGYYRRARQLHEAAKDHRGRARRRISPRCRKPSARLPGIGRYTAGAILSIAFDPREPILEANTAPVLQPAAGLRRRSAELEPQGQQLLWATAEAVLPRRQAGRFNQALMELGSEVCSARRRNARRVRWQVVPGECRRDCRRRFRWPRSRSLEAVREAAVLVRRGGRVLLLRWPEGRRWAGLWDFPRFEVQAEEPSAIHRELIEKVRNATGVLVNLGAHLKTIKHGVTRFRITLDCYEAEYVADADGTSNGKSPATQTALAVPGRVRSVSTQQHRPQVGHVVGVVSRSYDQRTVYAERAFFAPEQQMAMFLEGR